MAGQRINSSEDVNLVAAWLLSVWGDSVRENLGWAGIESLDKSLEDLLTRVDEFVGRLFLAWLLSVWGDSISLLQIESLDKSLEDLLTRVDEFVGMLDMIRSDSSQVVNESIPQIYSKATEMRQIYRKIDKLEAFVKMIGNSVAGLEERVIKAETDLGAFPSTFKKILHTIPSFLNKSSSSRQQQTLYEPPVLFKTEDYFPCLNEAPY
ncbi:biogenesis of lysosome-related organelles complex 1 subunit 4 [Egretta garzetta]|nr:biogenesis of lysosome-related organelles complex 1 subunit 4 [Egretta garzetta]